MDKIILGDCLLRLLSPEIEVSWRKRSPEGVVCPDKSSFGSSGQGVENGWSERERY
jgi:hypothetical protein